MPKRRFMVLQRAAVLPSDFSFSFVRLTFDGTVYRRISRVALFRPSLIYLCQYSSVLALATIDGCPFFTPSSPFRLFARLPEGNNVDFLLDFQPYYFPFIPSGKNLGD